MFHNDARSGTGEDADDNDGSADPTVRFQPVRWHLADVDRARVDSARRDAELDGPTRRLAPVPGPVDEDGPLDLGAMRADDALLTALASHSVSTIGPGEDAELKSLLQSWRLDVDAEPIGELVDVDTAAATIAVGARIHRRRPRYLVPLATAAAVLVVAFAGMGLAARNAEPGDALWGLSQMLYADHARSVEAAASVRSDLHHASEALAQGQFSQARTALVQAQQSLPAVANSDGKANLQAQQQTLLDQLNNTTGVPTSATSVGYGVPPLTTTTVPPATTTAPPATTTTVPPTTTPPPTTTTPPPTTTDTPQSGTEDAPGQQPTGNPPANNGNAVTDNGVTNGVDNGPAPAPPSNEPNQGTNSGTDSGTNTGTNSGSSSAATN